ERYGVPVFGPGYYATYDPPDPWWGGWLEWGLLQNDDHSWAFMAGATLPDGGAIPDDQQDTVAALADQGFDVFEFGRKVRIARVINPADLVGRGSLDDQARYL